MSANEDFLSQTLNPNNNLRIKDKPQLCSKEHKDNNISENISSHISIGQNKKNSRWTKEEDDLLISLVEEFEGKSWKKISSFIKNRTPIQCLHRWTKILKPGLVKGPWTAEEDKLLINWVKANGISEFHNCNNVIPGRNSKQCRERWLNVLNPKVLKGDWILKEDYMIFKLYLSFGGKWIKFVPFFKGLRAENSIKNRFYSTIRRFNTVLKKNKNTSLSEAEKIELIYKDLREKMICEYNLLNEQYLKEFEYKELGFVDKLEDKEPNNIAINKNDMIKLAHTANLKNKNNLEKEKYEYSFKNNIDRNKLLDNSKSNEFYVEFYNKYFKTNYNSMNNANGNINNTDTLSKYNINSCNSNNSISSYLNKDFFSTNGSLESNLFASNFEGPDSHMDTYCLNSNVNKNNKQFNKDSNEIKNQINTIISSSSNKAFNSLSLNELENKIMSYCGTSPNFVVQEDWNKSINNKFQSAFDDLDKILSNSNFNINNDDDYSINNINLDINKNDSSNYLTLFNNNDINTNNIDSTAYSENPFNMRKSSIEETNNNNLKNLNNIMNTHSNKRNEASKNRTEVKAHTPNFNTSVKTDTTATSQTDITGYYLNKYNNSNSNDTFTNKHQIKLPEIVIKTNTSENIKSNRNNENNANKTALNKNTELPLSEDTLETLMKQLTDLEELVKKTKAQISHSKDISSVTRINETIESLNNSKNCFNEGLFNTSGISKIDYQLNSNSNNLNRNNNINEYKNIFDSRNNSNNSNNSNFDMQIQTPELKKLDFKSFYNDYYHN